MRQVLPARSAVFLMGAATAAHLPSPDSLARLDIPLQSINVTTNMYEVLATKWRKKVYVSLLLSLSDSPAGNRVI